MEPATTIDPAGTPQHLKALEQANKVRCARAELKRQVEAGRLSAAQVIADRRWEVHTMPLSDLLEAQHRWGRSRTRRFLSSIELSENKAIGSLVERQRKLLIRALEAERETRRRRPVHTPSRRPALVA
jgi:hypothetical protein